MQTKEVDVFDGLAPSFRVMPFFRALSYRDFFTSISIALSVVALQALVRFLSSEEWLDANMYSVNITMLLLMVPVNHILFRIEHKRQNNFIGRVLHDFILIAAYWLINKFYTYLVTDRFYIDLEEDTMVVFFIIIVFIFLVMTFEAVIALLKRLLNMFMWQVL